MSFPCDPDFRVGQKWWFLADPLKDFVAHQIAEGRYSSVSEYIRELIREDDKRKAEQRDLVDRHENMGHAHLSDGPWRGL